MRERGGNHRFNLRPPRLFSHSPTVRFNGMVGALARVSQNGGIVIGIEENVLWLAHDFIKQSDRVIEDRIDQQFNCTWKHTSLQNNRITYPRKNQRRRREIICLEALIFKPCLVHLTF
ncbi:hypothetical protein MtrunA17_Chr5g0416921 [Medicago truncatula]|uniref:Uncharacterized protein n=1 Tax=Medicago truncatula TaxID=3880 RepID=G7KDW9_MEDTR|nr:hypothetical protein MTR_5g040200 [Medicago truncatula]RHN55357.1 hypothetical protein MtrunA17_Chr5g0416921 [Medicago truncatula]